VGGSVVGDDDTRFEREKIVPIVPLFAGGIVGVAAGVHDRTIAVEQTVGVIRPR